MDIAYAVGVSDKWGEKMIDGLIRRSDAIEVLACEMYAEAQSQGYEVDSIEDFMTEAKAWMNDAPSADRPQGDTVSRQYLLAEIDDFTNCIYGSSEYLHPYGDPLDCHHFDNDDRRTEQTEREGE